MQETFMKSSLYAICAGHKLRPARRVYSGFQNKIKTICIYDTPLKSLVSREIGIERFSPISPKFPK